MGKRIMITDDSAFMRGAIKEMLTKAGYEIAGEAESGEQAVMKYRTLKPDMVTMDIVMGGKTGLKALEEIIAFDPEALVLMVSGMGQSSYIVDAICAGAKAFVIKPFEEDQFLTEVRSLIGPGRDE